MKLSTFSLVCVLASTLSGTSLLAGDMYPISLKGTVSELNEAGSIAARPTTHTTMLAVISEHSGIPEGNLLLVYHIGGNVMGDTIDVINRNTGAVLETLYGFYFGEAFARRSLTNAAGSYHRRLDYIYTRQAGVAYGSAIISKKTVQVTRSVSRLVIQGSMQWIVSPENGAPGQICSAQFITGPQLHF